MNVLNVSGRSLQFSKVGLVCLGVFVAGTSQAQTPTPTPTPTVTPVLLTPLTTAGVANYADKKGRNPTLTVQQSHRPGVVSLLVNAAATGDFEKFPIQVDIFVNGTLFTSQIVSPTLPIPLGVDVPEARAALPFNFTVVAKIIHPNSVYTSALEGAAFPQNFADEQQNLACNVVAGETELSANAVTIERVGGTNYQFAVPELPEGGDQARVAYTLSANGGSVASGTVTLNDNEPTTVTGTVTSEGQSVTAIALANTDDSVSVSCSIEEIGIPDVVETPTVPEEDPLEEGDPVEEDASKDTETDGSEQDIIEELLF